MPRFPTLLLSISLATLLASPTAAQQSVSEDFTTTTLRDAGATTADWNTVAGELRLFPFAYESAGSFPTAALAYSTAIDGDRLYVAAGTAGLVVYDITDPVNPDSIGAYDTPNVAAGVVVSGDLAFVADQLAGLVILDVSDPTAPALLGTYNTPDKAQWVAVRGDLAFVADMATGLVIVDVTDPTSPVLEGTFNTTGSAFGVDVAGDHAYVADLGSGLQVIDISNPSSPSLAGTYNTPGNSTGVDVDGDHAYVADLGGGLQVIAVSDPTNPTLAGSYAAGTVRDVIVDGDRALLAVEGTGFVAVDISDPANPVPDGSYNTPGVAFGLSASGEFAYVADQAGGLRVVRIGYPAPPALLGSGFLLGNATDPVVAGNHLYGAFGSAGLGVFDITDPSSPTLVAQRTVATNFATGVAVDGDHLYVAYGAPGLYVYDISDPTNPSSLGAYNPSGDVVSVAVAGDLALIGVGSLGLVTLDVSSPATPTAVDTIATGTGDIVLAGDHAFVAAGLGGLGIVDISDPMNGFEVGQYNSPGNASGVAVAGDLAFLADGYANALRIVDISNPASPALLTSYGTTGSANDVTVLGDRAFVAAGASGLLILDISDPANPAPAGAYNTPGDCSGVTVAGDHAYLADGFGSTVNTVQVHQHDFDANDNQGQSIAVDSSDGQIVRARLSSTQSGGVSWELSADGGANFQGFTPGGDWAAFTVPGTDLLWRSTHVWSAPGVNAVAQDLTLDWLNEYALITSVVDIPNDQGRQVRVEWTRSGHDFVGDPSQIVEYAIYRRIDPNLSLTASRDPDLLQGRSEAVRENAQLMLAAGWDFLLTVPVLVEDEYAVVVPTLADSTLAEGDYQSVFRVTALTSTPGVFFHSPPDSGASLDNLAPAPPQALVADFGEGSINLDWDDAPESDFAYHRIYRDTDPGFVPSESNLVHETAQSGWTDSPADPGNAYYKVSTVDFSGNESGASSLEAVVAVGDGPVRPVAFSLAPAMPNPVWGSTRITYGLASDSRVALEIYDVTGRRVRTLLDATHPAGEYTASWDGADDSGRRVAAGVYLYRLRADGFVSTRRLVVIR